MRIEDYKAIGEEFWPKYWYVAGELGEYATPQDVLAVMEAFANTGYYKLNDKKLDDYFNYDTYGK